ncbi:S-adenosyl-L-methionine-dependent methyltransferase [Aspergillus ambiguus]|uniref:class I SAM-dependent methyltransferase n=1 Tax=Aspergillus ambiguus TaxID=176160 RepID=UPI003CCCC49A
MGEAATTQKDYWSSKTYATAASFVPHFADTLVQSIEFKPTDRVLDIGCGDGIFTASFAPAVGYVLGVDSSPSMIDSARNLDLKGAVADFRVVDCRHLEQEEDIINGKWDKVASNAAFHWILGAPSTRVSTLEAIYKSLKPGGTFFFENPGHGNAPEMQTAIMFALDNHGVPVEEAEAGCPWYYPSDDWMKKTLEKIGFKVSAIELKPKALKLTSEMNGGLEGFLRLIGGQMLDLLLDTEEKKESAMKQMVRMLRLGTTREDGTQWITYYSLRCVAIKP